MTNLVASNYLNTFLQRHPIKKYKKGEIIIFQGEVPRQAFALKSGIIKAYNLSVNGDEKPVAFYEKGSMFPLFWIFNKAGSAIYYYEAFSDEAEVYLVEKDKLLGFIKKTPELIYYELEKLLVAQLGSSIRLNALQHSKASDKLIYTLHYLALTHGKPAGEDIEIDMDLTHQDFANLTGLTRETAATELNKLKKKGIITYGKGVPYKLNLGKLNQLLNDQFIQDIKPDSFVS